MGRFASSSWGACSKRPGELWSGWSEHRGGTWPAWHPGKNRVDRILPRFWTKFFYLYKFYVFRMKTRMHPISPAEIVISVQKFNSGPHPMKEFCKKEHIWNFPTNVLLWILPFPESELNSRITYVKIHRFPTIFLGKIVSIPYKFCGSRWFMLLYWYWFSMYAWAWSSLGGPIPLEGCRGKVKSSMKPSSEVYASAHGTFEGQSRWLSHSLYPKLRENLFESIRWE